MDDLISRKALIAEYDRVHVGPPGGARKLMEDAPSVEQDWIPCKKPPTKNDAYLVTVHPNYIVPGGGQVDILVWVDDDWFFVNYGGKIARFPDPVIAWRPLPAPYKEDRNV